MANLNFQQPPRSIANSSINNRGGSFVGSGTSSLSGHVTPTSGMFPQSNASFATQSQLSPNRSGSVQLSGGFGQTLGNNSSGGAGSAVGGNTQSARTNLFGQRLIADRRQMPSLGPAVSSVPKHTLSILRHCTTDNLLIWHHTRRWQSDHSCSQEAMVLKTAIVR